MIVLKNHFLFFSCILFSIVIFGQERSSENFKMLKSIYEKHPNIDANNDGVLTETEYRKYQKKRFYRKADYQLYGYYDYIENIPYVENASKSYLLDIIIPENKIKEKLPAVIFIHGGGWKGGNKAMGLRILDKVLNTGKYIGISINYRLSGEAKWPSQIYDCNAAIRWVKANAEKYGIDKNKIAVWGTSAGGHIAAMLAMTPNKKEFEGNIGNHLNESAAVTCAIDGFGPTDFLMKESVSIIPKLIANKIENIKKVSYNVYNLLEGIEQQARNASPIYFVHKKAKPLFVYHGLQDSLVSIKHSERIVEKLKKIGANDTYLTKVEGLKHEPKISISLQERILQFLDKYLYDKKGDLIEMATVSNN